MHNYKYVANTHGNGNEWSNRFRSLLATGALVFKQESTLYEFWEAGLQPWVHYVPVNANMSDLPEKLRWAVENDERAQTIAQNGQSFVRDNVTSNRVLCYWEKLLRRCHLRRLTGQ